MSAIDELCTLLDYRDTEWHHDSRGGVWWTGESGHMYVARRYGNVGVELGGCLTPRQAVDVTLGHGATRIVTANGAVGHCNCSKCGGRIDTCDAWCRHCGSKLTETKYTTKGES